MVSDMQVSEIVHKYLVENKYEGLYNDDSCACTLDDLFPCEQFCDNCEPGVITECDCGEDCDWHIGPREGE